MRFVLDENVPVSVRDVLQAHGHSVDLIVDHVARGEKDPVVASVSERLQAVLISFDGDFEKIAPRIPEGNRRRFRKLSRIWFLCKEWTAALRLEKAMSLVETEYRIATSSPDKRMLIWISENYIKTHR